MSIGRSGWEVRGPLGAGPARAKRVRDARSWGDLRVPAPGAPWLPEDGGGSGHRRHAFVFRDGDLPPGSGQARYRGRELGSVVTF